MGALHDIRSKLTKEMKKLLERCEKDQRNINDEETAAFALADKIIDTINGEMDSREARGDRRPQGNFVPTPGNRGDGAVEREPRGGEIGRRYAELFHGRQDATLSRGEFKSFNEFLEVAASGKFDARTMTTGLTDGGAQVPEFWARDIYDATMEESACLGRCRMYPMQSGIMHIPAWDSHDHTQGPLGLLPRILARGNGHGLEGKPQDAPADLDGEEARDLRRCLARGPRGRPEPLAADRPHHAAEPRLGDG